MKRLPALPLIIAILITGLTSLQAQKVYSTTSGEMIFGLNETEFNDDFLATYPEAEVVKTNLRWTVFFHFSNFWHIDFNNNIGLISGLGVRNVGMITDERLPANVVASGEVYNGDYRNYKIIRRNYMAGIPLMLKFGSFKDNIYFYGGAEYELSFHFKEKYWSDTHSRDGSKTKYTEWFGSQSPTFIPSAIAGVQLPGGFHVKFKYYLDDFLDNTFGRQSGSTYSVSDLTRYESTQVFYFSLSWQFNTAYITKKDWQSTNTLAQYE